MIANMPAAAISVMQAQFNVICIHTVKLAAPIAPSDGYPGVGYGADTSYAAFVTEKAEQIRAASGEITVAAGRVLFAFPGPPAITPDYRLTLPDNRVVRILNIERDVSAVAGEQIIPTSVYYG